MHEPPTIPLTHLPASIAPDRVLAVCQVMSWPDDRHRHDPRCAPAGTYYGLAEDIVRAVDQAGPADPAAGHVLDIADNRAVIAHPPDCFVTAAGTDLSCLLADLVDEQVPLADLPAGRYEITSNDLGDRVLIGDRIGPTVDVR